MEIEIKISNEFGRQFKRLFKKYHSLLDDLNDFKESIRENPFQITLNISKKMTC